MPGGASAVDHLEVTSLRKRIAPATRALPDVGLSLCLSLVWLTDRVPLWIYLAYICVALASVAGSGARATVLRTAVVALIGSLALIRVHVDGHIPAREIFEVPMLAITTLLFGTFVRRRARSVQAILRDKSRLGHVVDRIPLATIAIDGAARVVTWNPAAERLFGWKSDEVIGSPNPIIPAGEQQHLDSLFSRISSGEVLQGVEVVRLAKDATLIEVAVYSAPLGNGGTLVLYDDIRDRKQVKSERDQAQRRYQSLIESLPLVTYIDRADDNATNIYTSPQVADILGWTMADWTADPQFFEEILHPDDRDRVLEDVREANETRMPFDSQYRLRHRDGHYVWVRDQSAIVDDGDGPFARGFLLDITEQKRLEEQLLQAHKLEALGQLAGGIAHDFNNLLTGIGGYAELATRVSEEGSSVSRYLEGIKTAAEEAATLTSRLLAFSRRDLQERRPIDLNEIARDVAHALERLVSANVVLQVDLTPTLPLVTGDPAQLRQVLLNLALNARDAMPGGGTLKIETTVAEDSVVVRVRDTGVGMDSATRSRAAEPFFTTKADGGGTGLGLSVAYGVVSRLGGRLSIDSAPGLGTSVEVALPAVGPAGSEPEERAGDEALRAGGVERVLVVEDREVVRNLAQAVLASAGFEVAAAAGGSEALDLIAASEPFDLLLTDVVMPEMSGPELAARLRADRPDLPVVYMSGYTDDVLGDKELSQTATTFVRKPFANAELIAALRGVLDTPPLVR